MKTFAAVVAATAFAGTALAGSSFYGGDFDGRNGGASETNATRDSRIYDNFDLNILTDVDTIFLNGLMNAGADGLQVDIYWEVRQNISEGNGGTVVIAGHTSPVTNQFDTGVDGFGRNQWQMQADVSGEGHTLAAGSYWLCVAFGTNSFGTGQIGFMSTTSGTNGVGGPLGDGNSFWDSTTFGFNFTSSDNVLGTGPWDFSMGLIGRPVPAPGALALLGVAGLAARRRRRA